VNSSATTKLSTKRLLVTYTPSESQVRFQSANYIKKLDDQTPNPCDTNECSVYAECIVESQSENGNGYYCQCKPGFEGDGNQCTDVNECDEGTAYCSPLAQCYNLLGHYECKCLPPRVGDGRDCQYDSNANTYDTCSRCNVNARCITEENSAYCRCNQGFVGNGIDCQPDSSVPSGDQNERQEEDDDSDHPYPPYKKPYEEVTTTTIAPTSKIYSFLKKVVKSFQPL
jgi:hypothetical protein